MATHKSAEKASRQADRRRVRNQAVRTEVKTAIKKLRTALSAKGVNAETVKTQLLPQFNQVQSVLMKAAKRKIIKKETASRQVSRLSLALHKLTQPKSA